MNSQGGTEIANSFIPFTLRFVETKNAYFHFLIKIFLKYNIFV
jgi:hypothetical protein